MKLVLPSIITDFQGAFIHERQISDGILITDELIDSRKRENKPGLVCKVDFEKAFDNINWNCADIVLQRFGFGNDQISTLKKIIFVFQLVSGLEVNFRKSAIIGNGDEHNGALCADLFGCQVADFPINYLGITLGSKYKIKAVWNIMLQRWGLRLRTWRRGHLSNGHRLILINSVLASMPIYYLSMFQMPISEVKELEKIMCDFLWSSYTTSKKRSWVKWSKAMPPKANGGIGIKKLKFFNKSLHCKWIWRCGREKDLYGERSFVRNLENGKFIQFWTNNWLGDVPFKDRFPNIFKISVSRDSTVKDTMSSQGS
ncbi:uncharacterized protein LOC113280127 [Papaver somniferum]|uniref:uncharacterized protein LOC113280127 n=1 Tax=Papaver somniferum TaxID=3469 RepID=UPI000E700065|nr:uncharacterized protein LOC113280127 [Papaver somniferum]